MQSKKIFLFSLLAIAMITATISGLVLAQTNTEQNNQKTGMPQGGQPGTEQAGGLQRSQISGTIATISGDTITLKSQNSYTITIDATSAAIKRNVSATSTSSSTSETISVSDLAVGDMITVEGNITVSAAKITAGTAKTENNKENSAEKPAAEGTIGTVTAISDSTITMTAKTSDSDTTTTYTVDASSATITKGAGSNSSTAAISDITTGNKILVKGTTSDTTITATSVSILSETAGQQDKKGMWQNIKDFFEGWFGGNKK
jgi:hypothetical protein